MSLLNTANINRTNGIDAWGKASNQAINRRQFNKQQEEQEKAQEKQAQGSALSTGITVGMYTGNPFAGIAAGAGMYLLGSSF